MSSAPESAKQGADGPASEEPIAKKPKMSETANGQSMTSSQVTDNGSTATEKLSTENTISTSGNTNETPTKAVNGNSNDNKEAKGEGEYDDEEGGESGNHEGVFDPKIAGALEQVESIQLEICNLNEKASEEILKVEQKFNKLRRPHFEKRNELLKGIPNFWLTSLANHPMIAPMIESAEDEDCLHYMVNLDVEEYEDIKSGYKLKLHFNENPYISNEVIVKEFQILSSEEIMSSSTPIEYKDTPQGSSLKQVVESSIAQFRRSRRPGQGQAQSFFAWLVEPSDTGTDEIAEILKDQIWPNPLEFFFATPEDYGAGTDDESDDEDEEIDDEDIDDEEDGVIAEGIEEAFSDEELDDGEDDDDDDDEDVE